MPHRALPDHAPRRRCSLVVPALVCAQYDGVPYVWEGNPAVQAKLEAWQDLKLGLHGALGDVQPEGLVRVVGAVLGGRGLAVAAAAVVPGVLRHLRRPEDHLRSRRLRCRGLGPPGPRRRACATSSSPPSTTTASACSTRSRPTTRSPTPAAPSTTTRAPTSPAQLFDAFRAEGLRDRRLLLQARLARALVLVAALAARHAQRQLPAEGAPRDLAEVRRLHARAGRGAVHRLRPARHPLARRRLGRARQPRPGPPDGPPRRDGAPPPAGPADRRPLDRRPVRELPHARAEGPRRAAGRCPGRPACRWRAPGPTTRTTSTSPRASSSTCWSTSSPRAATCCSTPAPTAAAPSTPTPSSRLRELGRLDARQRRGDLRDAPGRALQGGQGLLHPPPGRRRRCTPSTCPTRARRCRAELTIAGRAAASRARRCGCWAAPSRWRGNPSATACAIHVPAAVVAAPPCQHAWALPARARRRPRASRGASPTSPAGASASPAESAPGGRLRGAGVADLLGRAGVDRATSPARTADTAGRHTISLAVDPTLPEEGLLLRLEQRPPRTSRAARRAASSTASTSSPSATSARASSPPTTPTCRPTPPRARCRARPSPTRRRSPSAGRTSARPACTPPSRRACAATPSPRRTASAASRAQRLISHSLGEQLPVAKYGAEHPEYFALVRGERLARGLRRRPAALPHQSRRARDRHRRRSRRDRRPPRAAQRQRLADRQRPLLPLPRLRGDQRRRGLARWAPPSPSSTPSPTASPRRYPDAQVGTLAYWHTRKPPAHLRAARPTCRSSSPTSSAAACTR